jgi:hypothetical protein
MMVLFLRHLPHTVLPHQGELQRILITFNLPTNAFPRARHLPRRPSLLAHVAPADIV